MAGDWIKMRTDMYRDPKVCLIADFLMDQNSDLSRYVNQVTQRNMAVTRNVTRCLTVGALVSVWGVARHRGTRDGDDLRIDNATLAVVDDIADIPGFGQAMSEVGWVAQVAGGIVFPNFFEKYNVEPEDKREPMSAAERQRRYRERQKEKSGRNESNETLRNVALEERRVEKRREKKREVVGGCDPNSPPLRNGQPASQPESRQGVVQAWESWKSGEIIAGDIACIDRLLGHLAQEPVEIEGRDPPEPADLLIAVIRSAIEAGAEFRSPGPAAKYLMAIIERCRRERCPPGEFAERIDRGKADTARKLGIIERAMQEHAQ